MDKQTMQKHHPITLTWSVGNTGPDVMEEFTDTFSSFAGACRYLHELLIPCLIGILIPVEGEETDPDMLLQQLDKAAAANPSLLKDAVFLRKLHERTGQLAQSSNESDTSHGLHELIDEWNNRYHQSNGPWASIEIKE